MFMPDLSIIFYIKICVVLFFVFSNKGILALVCFLEFISDKDVNSIRFVEFTMKDTSKW